jgi:hypothetical protein
MLVIRRIPRMKRLMAQETVYGVWYYGDIDGRIRFGASTALVD